ncbi:PREDICTED: uncharacterized protein LOC108616380 [Drosophila arizonae]|uniref:Uncharacterized protein LOC108616380 n=1 Tax=Drosophila arizonae TaxID=7263 RepID=A0ABM1PII2_DROAR|nr:PREDICTED: uncharacterized protein LOC108616380 [Drosophila arizonae]
MELPVSEFNIRDLVRDLYGRALSTKGSKQELLDRLVAARHEKAEAQAQGYVRPGRPPVSKFGVCVQPDDFANIECMTDDEYTAYSKKVQWRLRRVHKTYDNMGLEYYHPGVLHRIDRSKTYTLNLNEFWVRKEPYVHKMFVVFVTRANAEEQRLCYARSLAMLRDKNLTVDRLRMPLIRNDEMGKALSNIMLEIEDNGLENYVAIVAPKQQLLLQALQELRRVTRKKLPPIVLDSCQVHNILENNFCAKSARCLYQLQHERFTENTYKQQLERTQENYTQNVTAAALLKEYMKPLPDVLLAMWKVEEHKGQAICLARLSNERLNVYCAQAQNDLPPITFEECTAGAGLLQLLLFDALWCLCDANEIEENNTTAILEPPLPDEWLPLLN